MAIWTDQGTPAALSTGQYSDWEWVLYAFWAARGGEKTFWAAGMKLMPGIGSEQIRIDSSGNMSLHGPVEEYKMFRYEAQPDHMPLAEFWALELECVSILLQTERTGPIWRMVQFSEKPEALSVVVFDKEISERVQVVQLMNMSWSSTLDYVKGEKALTTLSPG
ncbi:hypothetical protein DL766_005856 [Monosporascus sp. MC13-8B]|nr:hypothetical protein DL763_008859 [Monosporascus cannonballus]RYP28466.1 hypothetical protein DL766_005856 [Monosporascus sp. MC13-8B]